MRLSMPPITPIITITTVLVALLFAAFQHRPGSSSSSPSWSYWLAASQAADVIDATCDPQDGSCHNDDKGTAFQVVMVNESPYRADVYWDDDRFGKIVATLQPNGDEATFQTFAGHRFFVTRHGVRENLFDLEKDEPYSFSASHPSEKFVIPKTAAPSPNRCQDRYAICPQEASRGSCTNNPGWMIVHCCKSCDAYLDASRLIDPKVRCAKENLNTTDPIWKPGDLNKLFEEWATSKDYEQYEPHVWSSPEGHSHGLHDDEGVQTGPWVMTFDNFFSAEEAQSLIEGGRMVGFDRSTDQGKVNAAGEMEKIVSQTRTSSNAWCVGQCEQLPHVKEVTARIERVTHIPSSHYESFQILEYQDNQFYRSHHDSSNNKDESPAGHRILTFFLYLSDVEEGGETYFNRLNLAVRPKLGRALVWPSVLNDQPNRWDPRMFHEAKDVIKGTKYAANHWIHLNDYLTPNIWGCTGSFG